MVYTGICLRLSWVSKQGVPWRYRYSIRASRRTIKPTVDFLIGCEAVTLLRQFPDANETGMTTAVIEVIETPLVPRKPFRYELDGGSRVGCEDDIKVCRVSVEHLQHFSTRFLHHFG